MSLVFYAWGEPAYIWLMLVSVLVNWLFGIALGTGSQGRKRVLPILNLLVNLALLGFFKYEGFVAGNVNALLGSQVVPDLELSFPIGIYDGRGGLAWVLRLAADLAGAALGPRCGRISDLRQGQLSGVRARRY